MNLYMVVLINIGVSMKFGFSIKQPMYTLSAAGLRNRIIYCDQHIRKVVCSSQIG